MIVRLVVLAAFAAVTLPADLKSQDRVAPESVVERTAVQAALAQAGLVGSGLRIVIDPNAVDPDEAPGKTAIGLRNTGRSEYLRQSFAATVRPRVEFISCDKRGCELRNADLMISLSNPQVAGDEASISVTIERSGRKGLSKRLYYETNRFHLKRVGGAWKVDRVEQLGIA